ncbi:YOR019W-like protein [Saccharomyces kudriavzevii IFO 1802]|uniref:YOR019W-like protein n=1 Tax=Saccharomyces kudriavzevii (strain ATCC MYA-4449 / AS 2.2408 / CBS 8840 / NBRC 1802 / NCYC 2889) TaxID=226230 RepID=J5PYL3_SACK1|nr:YOR019W-like protein [Saccharomyces kudriavzevii IFO 1802]
MVSICLSYDLQTCYRDLTFDVPGKKLKATNGQSFKKESKETDNFQPSVAFDTVPSTVGYSSIDDSREGFKGVPVPSYYAMDECYDNETDSFSPNLQYYLRDTFQSSPSLKTRKGANSESNSFPVESSKLLKKNSDIRKIFLISQNGKIVRRDYPSTPVITNEALMINRFEKNWKKLWRQRKSQINERLHDKKMWFTYPNIIFSQEHIKPLYRGDDAAPCTKEQKRKYKIFQKKIGYPNNPKTILCYINGKKHTWVALDWTLCKIAQSLDHIVVITTLPRLIFNKKKRLEDDTEWASGYQKETINQKLSDIFEYILQLLKVVKISVKVTLEIVIGKTKKTLVDAINVHTPDLLVFATLKHERNENIIVYKSKGLTDVFSVSFPIPMFVVPSKRMYSFELNLQRQVNEHFDHSSGNNYINNESTNKNSINASLKENVFPDIPSEISVDSYAEDFKKQGYINKHSSPFEDSIRKRLVNVAQHSRKKITGDIANLHNDEKERKFSSKEVLLTKIDIIIKESLKSSLEIDTMPGDNSLRSSHNERLVNFKNSLIGSESKGAKFSKSLISYSPSQEQDTSKIISTSSPPTSQIKFATTVKHKDGRAALGKAKNLPDMRHSSSFEKENSFGSSDKSISVDSSNSLRKVKSAGALRKVKTNDSSSSAGSRKSSSSFSTVNTFTGGGVGIFRVFKSGSSSGNKSSSRRNSTGSDVLEIDDRGTKKKKKKKKSLFSFGKL